MHDGMMNGYGMHGGMLQGWQNNPTWGVTPNTPNNSVPTYPTPTSSVSFKTDVQPIFAARCAACHGGTNGLYLDTYENVLKGGINGAVVIPGDVYNSRLASYVYSGYMPFRNTSLTSTEIQTILDWIALGAPNN
jgi:mono/diheme cytochrome c family protein